MRTYSRMKNGGDDKDHGNMGGNPCLEQTLESYELCCLVETFPNNHDSLEDYQRTLKYILILNSYIRKDSLVRNQQSYVKKQKNRMFCKWCWSFIY